MQTVSRRTFCVRWHSDGFVVSKAREAFLAPNIDRKGRLARALYGCAMIVAGCLLNRASHPGLAAAAILAGGFAWLEAARGWCIVRACSIKTKW